MSHMVYGIGRIFSSIRDSYVAVQDDLPEGWNLSSTLTFIGLRALSPDSKNKNVPPTEEEAREFFVCQPTHSFKQTSSSRPS
jgi:hypothetical protein